MRMPPKLKSDRDVSSFLDGISNTTFAIGSEQLIDHLHDVTMINDAIDRLRADAQRMKLVASRSSRHGLGFDRIELWRSAANDAILRLHVWWNPKQKNDCPAMDIHNHGRPLSIYLAHGSYSNEQWTFQHGAGPYIHFRYAIDDKTLKTSEKRIGDAQLTLFSKTTISAGDTYSIAPNTLHRIVPVDGEPTISLVLQGPLEKQSSDVFTLHEGKYSLAGGPVFGTDELYAKLEQVQMLLRKSKLVPNTDSLPHLPSKSGANE